MIRIPGKGIVQICFVVTDLDTAIKRWVNHFGAGPFYKQRHLDVPVMHRGKPSNLDIHVALGQSGDLQVELIEPANDGPSVYREMYGPGEQGFHHVAHFIDDFQKEVDDLLSAGASMGAVGEFAGSSFAYIDTRSTLGFFTELYEESAGMRQFYKNIADGAKGWDGSDPIRALADVAP